MNRNKALCGHIKGLFSKHVSNRIIMNYVSKVISMDDDTFLDYCGELNLLITKTLSRETFVPSDFNRIGFKSEPNADLGREDIVAPAYQPKDELLDYILSGPIHCPVKDRLRAAMMKLKTAVPPRSPRIEISRSKYIEHSKSIMDEFTGNQTLLDDLVTFFKEAVPYLIRKAKLEPDDHKRYFMNVLSIPQSVKAFACVMSDYTLKGIRRDQIEAYNYMYELQHPMIHKIYHMDPQIFLTRVISGNYDVCLEDFQLPKPVQYDFPLMRISFIPNPARKERVVASDSKVKFSLSYPIGKVLKAMNSKWKIQGVDSHPKCCEDIMLSLRKDRIHYSIDMSNFTDRLPYELSRTIVESLVTHKVLADVDLAIMDFCVKSKVQFTYKGKTYVGKYGVGTPMGTYPSFPAASLANGLVATYSFCKATGIPLNKIRWDHLPFRVIGDDIVIYHDQTAKLYMQFMNNLGVKVQPSKCMISAKYAEMCSKLITPNGVYEQRKLDKISTFMDKPSLDRFKSILLYYNDDSKILISESGIDPNGSYSEFIDSWLWLPRPEGLGPIESDPIWDELGLRSLLEARKALSDIEMSRLTPADMFETYSRLYGLPKFSIRSNLGSIRNRRCQVAPHISYPHAKSLVSNLKILQQDLQNSIDLVEATSVADNILKLRSILESSYNQSLSFMKKATREETSVILVQKKGPDQSIRSGAINRARILTL